MWIVEILDAEEGGKSRVKMFYARVNGVVETIVRSLLLPDANLISLLINAFESSL